MHDGVGLHGVEVEQPVGDVLEEGQLHGEGELQVLVYGMVQVYGQPFCHQHKLVLLSFLYHSEEVDDVWVPQPAKQGTLISQSFNDMKSFLEKFLVYLLGCVELPKAFNAVYCGISALAYHIFFFQVADVDAWQTRIY